MVPCPIIIESYLPCALASATSLAYLGRIACALFPPSPRSLGGVVEIPPSSVFCLASHSRRRRRRETKDERRRHLDDSD